MATVVDTVDWQIINVLRENARMSIRQIAKLTGIKPSTVHNRIRRMVRDGIIEKFTVKLNEKMVGEEVVVFVLLSGTLDRYLDKGFIGQRNVKAIYGVTGEYDLLLKLAFRDMEEFNDFLISFREKYSGHISKTVTMVQTIKLKD